VTISLDHIHENPGNQLRGQILPTTRKKTVLLSLSTLICLILHKSYRYRFFNTDNRLEAQRIHKKSAFVIASWHQNCFAGILGHAGQGFALLVSRSLDGEIVSRLAKAIGLQTVRGSSKKGGQEALDILIERTHDGLRSAFTVDGPKGPIFEVKRGVFVLAAKTGAPILPMAALGARYWTLSKSWDKFRIPKPFTKVSVLYGKPMTVTDEDLLQGYDDLKARLTKELITLEIQAVNMGLCPHPGILPLVIDAQTQGVPQGLAS
jgi:lysophospholipid acyltransferase (LPLAT)-like uncharacterized protein